MRVVKDTPFEVGFFTWQRAPARPVLTVVVKGTFRMVPRGKCVVAEEQRPTCGEVPLDEEDSSSLRYDTDFAPFKPRGEWYLVGACHAPAGRWATMVKVEVRVGPSGKTCVVFGDRFWEGERASAAEAFRAMPLCWERSFGGPGFEANPVGAGLAAVTTPEGPRVKLPNIEDPRRPLVARTQRPDPVGFFPIPSNWPVRLRKTGTYDARWLSSRWPWLPEDFDWSYYNSSPLDQQIEGFWRGDEPIVIENLHPVESRIETCLPGRRARAFLRSIGGGKRRFEEIPLRLDTICVDAESSEVICLWRGLREVGDESLSDVEHLFVTEESISEDRTVVACEALLDRALAEEAQEEAGEPGSPEDGPGHTNASGLNDREGGPKAGGMEADQGLGIREGEIGTRDDLDLMAQRRQAFFDFLACRESLAGQDFSGVDLSGADLRGALLAGAILQGARLSAANLEGAVLDEAILAGADLTAARAHGASLRRADLTAVVAPGVVLDEAILDEVLAEKARLPGATLRKASLRQAELMEADLRGACLDEATLDEADLEGALVDDATFVRARLVDTTLEGAQASRTRFDDADCTKLRASEKARFAGASFERARAVGARFSEADLAQANFAYADLQGADFSGANLREARLSASHLRGARFQGACLVSASLLQADAFEANFEGADLSQADLRGANLFGAEFWRARSDQTRLEYANLGRTKLAR